LRIPDWKWILKWKVFYRIRHGRSLTRDYELAVREALVPMFGDSFWDVGANTGYYTFMLAKNFVQVTSFEPNPAAIEILNRKIRKHRIANVKLAPIALCDSPGRARLYLRTRVRERTIGSSNSLVIPPDEKDKVTPGQAGSVPTDYVEVETDTVDNLLGSQRISLMKIDVEGAEFLVLAGAKRTLEEGRVDSMMIELHDERRKDELDSFLKDRHYRVRWLDYAPGSVVSRVLATLEKPR